jgi:hypothetical protein
MKKTYLFKNTSRLFVLMGIAATTWLSSCKDTSPGAVNFADSPALVGFQYYGFQATPIQTKVHGLASDSAKVEVTLSVHTIVLKSPVTCTIATDDADGATYAAAQTAAGSKTYVVPASDYTIANGGNLTIAPGQQIVTLKMAIKGNLIDFSNPDSTYIIPIKIVSASGAIIATNLNVAFLQLTLQSIYEGHYTATGSFVDNVVSADTDDGIYPESIDLKTVNPYSVVFNDLSFGYGEAQPLNGGSGGYGSFAPVFNFDPSGSDKILTVTNIYGQGAGLHMRSGVIDPTGINAGSGTPGTSGYKIQVKFFMYQGDEGENRLSFNVTYTYDGPAI